MQCHYCGHKETKVTNKRDIGPRVRRRRECIKCKKRFTTYEIIEPAILYVIKKDGRREKFDIQKLGRGVNLAFEKRPIPEEKIQKLINEVETNIRKRGREVKSSVIGELVMREIERLDKVAYVRFASVYREFKDLSDFKKEMRSIK